MAGDGGLMLKVLQGLRDRQVQHFGYVLASESHIQSVAVVAGAMADFAGHIHIGQEVHLNLEGAVARTGFAASAFHIEREAAHLIAPHTSFVGGGEELADMSEDTDVGGGVGARGASDGLLVYVDDLVYVLHAVHAAVQTRRHAGVVYLLHQHSVEDAVDQSALARPRHARDRHEAAERELHIYVLEVVLSRPVHHEPPARRRTAQ